MKKTTLAAICCAAAATLAMVSTPAAAGERLDQIVKTNTIRVGTPGDYRPFAMKEDTGFAGHDIDVVNAMAKVYGWKVEFVQTSWKKMAEDLKANRFDVAVGGITSRMPFRKAGQRSPRSAIAATGFAACAYPFGRFENIQNEMSFTSGKASKIGFRSSRPRCRAKRIASENVPSSGFQ